MLMQPTITQPAANPPANNDNALPIPLTPLFNEYRKDTCLVQMQQQNYVISHALLVSLTESIVPYIGSVYLNRSCFMVSDFLKLH